MGFIYFIGFPKFTEEMYIGQTIRTMEERMKEHAKLNSKCPAIRDAIQEYGIENARVDYYFCPDEELNDHEPSNIKLFGTLHPNGYNLTEGGDSGGAFSEKTKQKLKIIFNSPEFVRAASERAIKRWLDPKYRQQVTQKLIEFGNRPENIEMNRDRSIKLWQDQIFRQRVSELIRIAANLPENIEANRDRSIKLWQDPDFRQKTVAGIIASHNTEDYKKITSKMMIELWADDEYRQGQMETRNSPEYKQKHKKNTTNLWATPEFRLKHQKTTNEEVEKLIEEYNGDMNKIKEVLGIKDNETLKKYLPDGIWDNWVSEQYKKRGDARRNKNKARSILAKHIETNNIIRFDTIKKASDDLQINYVAIQRKLNTGKIHEGYIFEDITT